VGTACVNDAAAYAYDAAAYAHEGAALLDGQIQRTDCSNNGGSPFYMYVNCFTLGEVQI
jgi:hypothetical protein